MAEFTKPPYRIGLPGGPANPFWCVINQKGNVVAMQITTEANARLLIAAPALYKALKDAPYPPDVGADEYYIVDVWLPKYTKWRRGINEALALADKEVTDAKIS